MLCLPITPIDSMAITTGPIVSLVLCVPADRCTALEERRSEDWEDCGCRIIRGARLKGVDRKFKVLMPSSRGDDEISSYRMQDPFVVA